THRNMISTWAVKNGYAHPTTVFELSWYDDEDETRRAMTFTDRIEAETELEEYEGMDPRMEEQHGFVATSKLKAETRQSDIDPGFAFDMLATVYTDLVLGWDGVWWEDQVDAMALSLPRGVIF